jgi:hypothetical protein
MVFLSLDLGLSVQWKRELYIIKASVFSFAEVMLAEYMQIKYLFSYPLSKSLLGLKRFERKYIYLQDDFNTTA